MTDIIIPDEFTLPPDLKNLGLKCQHCHSAQVVFHITDPFLIAAGFPLGAYCYKCLLNHCRAASKIPYPIEINLLDRLRVDLGLDQVKSGISFRLILPRFLLEYT